MYQQLTLIGNLGRDPEMRYTPTGVPVTNFSMAVSRNWVGQDGQRQEKTIWFRVTAWRKLATSRPRRSAFSPRAGRAMGRKPVPAAMAQATKRSPSEPAVWPWRRRRGGDAVPERFGLPAGCSVIFWGVPWRFFYASC
ncbi:MAG: single-stranded DNA-binding protein [Caldilinea sp.]|nr:single-stranded DNA-binding protein [Caldilinea sp.]